MGNLPLFCLFNSHYDEKNICNANYTLNQRVTGGHKNMIKINGFDKFHAHQNILFS